MHVHLRNNVMKFAEYGLTPGKSHVDDSKLKVWTPKVRKVSTDASKYKCINFFVL